MNQKLFFTMVFAGIIFFQFQAQAQQTGGTRRTTAYFEETVGNLTNQIRLLQDENAKLTESVYSLKQELKELKARMQSYQAETAELRKMIAAESESRKQQMGNIADKIQQVGEQSAAQNAIAQSEEEYDYYIVESGATLSAVSRATGISVARLKKVNGMTNDILRVGQKLKIPRK